jgi:hypothetical protein
MLWLLVAIEKNVVGSMIKNRREFDKLIVSIWMIATGYRGGDQID